MSRAAPEFATAGVLAVSQLILFRWSMLTLLWCVVFTSVSHFWGCGLLSGGKCFHFTQMSFTQMQLYEPLVISQWETKLALSPEKN